MNLYEFIREIINTSKWLTNNTPPPPFNKIPKNFIITLNE